jgi:hypothetical protein
MGGNQSPVTETISTGQTVELPLSCHATVAGVTVTANTAELASLLPAGLAPVRLTPRRGLLVLAVVDYERVGDFEPYGEFTVIVPTVERATAGLPVVGGLTGLLSNSLGGWIQYMPVTTEPARALGVDIWGYPKEVADVAIDERADSHHATVRVDGDHVVSLDAPHARERSLSVTFPSYTRKDGTVLREAVTFDGRIGVRPFGAGTVTVGAADHHAARDLRRLDLGPVLGTFSASDLTFDIPAGEPI